MAWWRKGGTAGGARRLEEQLLDDLAATARDRIGDDESRAALLRRPSDERAIPTSGAARDDWIGDQIEAAFRVPVAAGVYRFDEALAAAVRDTLRNPDRLAGLLDGPEDMHTRNERDALAVAARYASLARGGVHALRRIDDEVDALADQPDEVVTTRFAGSPPARMDDVPADAPRRRHWLREMLTGEAASIAGGMMSPDNVARAATRARFPVVHERPADASPIVVRFPAWHPNVDTGATRLAQAHHIADRDDERLKTRFQALPDTGTPPHDRAARVSWAHRALTVEAVRRMAALDAAGASLPVDLLEIVQLETGAFAGHLTVAGERLCRVTCTTDGEITADLWSEGCGPEDIEALDMLIAVTGEARDDGETPDSLAVRIFDMVAMHVATTHYREAVVDTVLFVVEGRDRMDLLSITIPPDGTREGATAAMRAAHPDAVPLDDMAEGDAVTTWMTLAGASDPTPRQD